MIGSDLGGNWEGMLKSEFCSHHQDGIVLSALSLVNV